MAQPDPAGTTYGLTELPEGSKLRSVTAIPAEVAGRWALRVELTDAVTLKGQPGVDYVIIARGGTISRPWTRLLDDVKSALIRLAADRESPHI